MKRRTLILSPALLAACTLLPQRPYQQSVAWPLIVPPPDPARSAARGAPSLVVRSLRAAPGLESRSLQSLEPDGSLRASAWEEWVASPAQAAESALRQYLSASGLFSAVVAPGTRLLPTFAFEGVLDAFWVERKTGRAVARISYVLIDLRRGDSVALQDVASGTAALQGNGPEADQAALRTALGGAFAQITAQIAASLHPPGARSPRGT